MAYDDLKTNFVREPATIVELDVDFCSNTYGAGFCQAALGVTGETQCYNGFGACQDRANYDRSGWDPAPEPPVGYKITTRKYYFSNMRINNFQQPGELPLIPIVTGVSTAPAVLDPGNGLGLRASISVSFSDLKFNDKATDPYYSIRSPQYQADENLGTFWGRFFARNRYMLGRAITVRQGFLVNGKYDAANFVTRKYAISKVTGPGTNGKVTIDGRDFLRFADNSKRQIPSQSRATLVNAITSGETASIRINDPQEQIKNAIDSGQTYLRIGDEILNATGYSVAGVDIILTGVTRGAAVGSAPSYYERGTGAEDHDSEAEVQSCFNFQDTPVNDLLQYLLETVVGIDPQFLDLTGWQEVYDTKLFGYDFSRLLFEPTGVNKLLEELTQLGILIWWDERDAKIKIDSILILQKPESNFTQAKNFLINTLKTTTLPEKRVTQTWLHYGIKQPLLDNDKIQSYSNVSAIQDVEAESAAELNEPKVVRIYSEWLPRNKGSIAQEIAQRLVDEYNQVKNMIQFSLDAKDDDNWTGDIVTCQVDTIQDEVGNAKTLPYRILEVGETISPGVVVYKYTCIETLFNVLTNATITLDSQVEYDLASEDEKNNNAFIAPNLGNFSDGRAPYTIV